VNNLMFSQTLRKGLADWADGDVAPYYVAIALGIAPDPGDEWGNWGGRKGIFWSNNPLGNTLFKIVEQLVAVGVLEQNEQGLYRWNSKFDWEKT
jgi:hypothetical protein